MARARRRRELPGTSSAAAAADCPSSPTARARRSSTPPGGATSTPPAVPSSSASATASPRWRTPSPTQAGRVAYAHGTVFASDALEAYADELAPLLPVDDAAALPGVGRQRGGRDRAEDGPGVPPGSGRGPARRRRPAGRVPRQHPGGAGRLAAATACAAPYLPWLGGPAHHDAVRVPLPVPGHPPRRLRRAARRGARALICEIGPSRSRRSSPSPSPARPWAPACRRSDYWPAVAGGVPPARGAADRRRGDDRLRPHRTLVRRRALGLRPDIWSSAKGAASGYWPLGLAVAAARCTTRSRAAASPTGSPTPTTRSGAAAGLAVLAVPARPRPGRRRPRARRAARRGPARRPRRPPGTSATSAAWACCAASSSSPTGGPARRSRGPTGSIERIVAAGRRRGVLLYSSTGCADGTDGDLDAARTAPGDHRGGGRRGGRRARVRGRRGARRPCLTRA